MSLKDLLNKCLENISADIDKDNFIVDEITGQCLTKDQINSRQPGADEDILAEGLKIIDVF